MGLKALQSAEAAFERLPDAVCQLSELRPYTLGGVYGLGPLQRGPELPAES
jgi:hypothetical protein